ncbi:MAG: hypothetical protein GQE15_25870 [Archangiaceae bacterium]|nr:hypothetical protein [Archangiaceae bacterium]
MNQTEQSLREELEALRVRLAELERRRSHRNAGLVVALVLVAGTAWGQLVVFSPDTPAKASEVNQNFDQLKTWLEQKVGTAGTSVVTFTTPLAGAQLENLTVTGGKLADNAITSTKIADNSVTAADVADGTLGDADMGPDFACPATGVRATRGQCIFYRPSSGPAYIYNVRAAATACLADRARLCTRAELSAAQIAGLENCAFGWLADRVDSATGFVGYPMQTAGVPGCGSPGVNEISASFAATYGAWCCK